MAARIADPLIETYIHVTSVDRKSPSPSTSVSTNPIAIDLAAPVNSVIAVELLTATIPKTFNNVSVALDNNHLFFTDHTGSYDLTIPDGAYGAADLLTFIQTQINSISAGYTVSISSTTFKVTFTYVGAGNITLDFTRPHTIGGVLGFLPQVYSGAQTYTAPKVINLNQPYTIFVALSQACSSGSTSASLTAFNWAINMGGAVSGDTVVWKQGQEYLSKVVVSKTNLKALNFTLTDNKGNAIDLNGAEWDLLIRVYSESTGRSRDGISLPMPPS